MATITPLVAKRGDPIKITGDDINHVKKLKMQSNTSYPGIWADFTRIKYESETIIINAILAIVPWGLNIDEGASVESYDENDKFITQLGSIVVKA